jgi:hypothetical protein
MIDGPLTIDCSPGGNCTFNAPLLTNIFGNGGLGLSSCTIGECIEQYVIDQALGVVATTDPGNNGLSGGVIAGLVVVGIILLAIICVIMWGFVSRARVRRGMISDGDLPKSGGVGVKWSAVGYEVKSGRNPWTKTMIWMKGGGGGGGRSATSEAGDMVGPKGGKIVLQKACGELPAGGFCCILGPSGAGKSTLVDILAGKRKGGRVEGIVGYTTNPGQRVRIGYVDQVS